MSQYVELHNTGRWNDDVGYNFNKAATKAVTQFIVASQNMYKAIAVLDSYSEKDIHYESQRENIYRMRVELKVNG